ncbi:UNVERIFIED_CONTAM: hypothetical protein PYX00_009004 [Menopon gallinae]|uniref:Vacuolar protein n=1 Tax=Menopon gallinae TaxID=328185 RepID=A0AAW2H9J2_9NEOP
MPALNVPPCPPCLKSIQHYLKTAAEHDDRDIVVAYWCRLYALQTAIDIGKSNPEANKLFLFLMDWLEKTKVAQKDNEAIAHEIPAQAHLENYALKLFLWADSQDRASVFNKNVVKAFYTAGMIYDVLEIFGTVTEEVQKNRKYAKWKAAYIHNCLKNGETPVPGPMQTEEEGEGELGFKLPSMPNPEEPPRQSTPPPTADEVANMEPPKLPTPPERPAPDPLSPPVEYNVPDLPPQTGIELAPEQITKAQKYCKWASSALNYDDVTTAVENLQKALRLLTTGADE